MISDELRTQYRNEGYFLLERVIPEEQLEAIRRESERFMKEMDDEFDRKGTEQMGLNRKGSRYFINLWFKRLQSEPLRDFLFSNLMAEVCRATIGDTAYLFHEQFVIKGADQGMKFSWHQDSGYVSVPHTPYVTIWCTLDDVTVENGTVYILPYSKAGTRDLVKHSEDAELRDKIGYTGDEEGIPVELSAGSLAVFSSLVFHRSGPNTTSSMRRIYLPQYSPDPILKSDGSPWAFADPFLLNGEKQSLPSW
jgi:ectoine hydroxylase-related dioxygenase (phytanoyl-CoA dioxygenase family)